MRQSASASPADAIAARLIRPPVPLLLTGAVAAVVAAVLHVPGARLANVIGYVAGTVLTIFPVALFRREDRRRSAGPLYSPVPVCDTVSAVVLVVGVVAAIGHIWHLAERTP